VLSVRKMGLYDAYRHAAYCSEKDDGIEDLPRRAEWRHLIQKLRMHAPLHRHEGQDEQGHQVKTGKEHQDQPNCPKGLLELPSEDGVGDVSAIELPDGEKLQIRQQETGPTCIRDGTRYEPIPPWDVGGEYILYEVEEEGRRQFDKALDGIIGYHRKPQTDRGDGGGNDEASKRPTDAEIKQLVPIDYRL